MQKSVMPWLLWIVQSIIANNYFTYYVSLYFLIKLLIYVRILFIQKYVVWVSMQWLYRYNTKRSCKDIFYLIECSSSPFDKDTNRTVFIKICKCLVWMSMWWLLLYSTKHSCKKYLYLIEYYLPPPLW
jgi:hypothetical protein